jgi:hypothetical protein
VEPAGRRWFVGWICCAVVLLCPPRSFAATGEYRTIEVESLRITYDSEWAPRTAPGYMPIRFDITNFGDARVIEIYGQGNRFFRMRRPSQPGALVVRQRIQLARGDRIRFTLPVPIIADSENLRLELREDDRVIERFNFLGFQSGTVPGEASALIVADPRTTFGRTAASWPRTIPTGPTKMIMSGTGTSITGAPSRLPPLDLVLEPSRLPTNWLGFTSLRAVFVGPEEWTQLDAGQKHALLTWTACGGDLFFVDGDARALLPDLRTSPVAGDSGARAYFFGRIHTPSSSAVASSGLHSVLVAAEKLQDENWVLPANRARDWGVIAARGFRLPIPGVEGVPARAYLSILLVFSLLIGPMNYWLLWRKRRQVLFVLTTPIISALFIVLLAGYVVIGEGLGVSGRATSLTMLDQAAKQAATRSTTSLYAAGMTPAGGLRFARDTAVYAIGVDGSGTREPNTLDLSEAQRYSSGVIQARSATNLEQIGFRTARERLTFTRQGSEVEVMNGLGETVTHLIHRIGTQVYSLRAPLASGARGTLHAGAIKGTDVVPSDIPLSGRLMHLVDHLPEGSYIAILERSPFVDFGVRGVLERASFHVVIGWPEGQP